jgi:hypothetical protein
MNKYIRMTAPLVILITIASLFLFSFPYLAGAEDTPINLEIGIAGEDQVTGVTDYIATIYLFASGIVAGLAAVMIVIGGIQYATAAGNPKGIASAKETITSAIIGLVIVGAGYLILRTFGTQFTNLKEPTLETLDIPEESAVCTKLDPVECSSNSYCYVRRSDNKCYFCSEKTSCGSYGEHSCSADPCGVGGCYAVLDRTEWGGHYFNKCAGCRDVVKCIKYRSDENSCLDNNCNVAGSCYPSYGRNDWGDKEANGCKKCPTGACNCSIYKAQKACESDPCACGSCSWNGNTCQKQ